MVLRIVIVGIAGVGKSTVVQKAVESIDGAGVVIFGTQMLEAARRLGWVKNRDEMRRLRVEKQRRLQRLAADEIGRARGKKVIFVDTHLFIRTQEGFWPGLPLAVIHSLKPTHLILIEADPEEILKRRMNDTSRDRDTLTADEVNVELTLARTFLSAASLVSGAPLMFISNREGKADEAAERIVKLVKSATP